MNGDEERGIPVITSEVLYKQFLDSYLRPLKPCIISNLTKDWLAAKEWVTTDSVTGIMVPNFATLKNHFGECDGCVTFCSERDSNGELIRREMSVTQFIDTLASNRTTQKQYLKDFHFMRLNKSNTTPYTVPKFFEGI